MNWSFLFIITGLAVIGILLGNMQIQSNIVDSVKKNFWLVTLICWLCRILIKEFVNG
jgi:hypothetical protein